jgi:CelD/BcsL family acetyltransferase involved in cellulose biosynthesis
VKENMEEPLILAPRDPRWLSLIEKDSTATIFHHPAWMELLSACYGYRPFIFAIPDRNGQVCAAVPIAEVKNLLKSRRYVALPFTDYCQPLFRDEESLCSLAASLVEQQQTKRFPKLEIRSALPAQANIQTSSPFVLHTVPLDPDFTRVAKRANRQQIQNVRKAEKNDIRIVRGTGLAEVRAFYRLHSLNRRKHGVPVQPWNFFKLLTRLLLEEGLGFMLLAYKEEACISAGLFLHWQRTLTYKYSATDEAYLNVSPNHLVTWTAMKWGCENGFTTFDFGRAEREDEGLRAYKCRWGAGEIPLTYSYIPSASGMITRGDGRLSTMLKELIRRSPIWVGQVIGRIMYRYVG